MSRLCPIESFIVVVNKRRDEIWAGSLFFHASRKKNIKRLIGYKNRLDKIRSPRYVPTTRLGCHEHRLCWLITILPKQYIELYYWLITHWRVRPCAELGKCWVQSYAQEIRLPWASSTQSTSLCTAHILWMPLMSMVSCILSRYSKLVVAVECWRNSKQNTFMTEKVEGPGDIAA